MNRGHTNSISSQNTASAFQSQTRGRNEFGSAGDKAVPVPGSSVMYRNGVDRKSSMGGNGTPLFDLARSPPNHAGNKSKSSPGPRPRSQTPAMPSNDASRHETRPMQVLSSRRLSSRLRLSILPFNGSDEPASSLQVFHEGTLHLHNHAMPTTRWT